MGEYFHGYALNAVDAKNRLSIPAAYRETIEKRSASRTVVLAPAERAPCLVGYDRGYSDLLAEQLRHRFADDYSDARDNFARFAFGGSEPLTIDDNGRVILTPMLKDLGELDRHAFFLAAGDYFEIWNPRRLLDQPGLDPRLDRIVRRQLETKGEG